MEPAGLPHRSTPSATMHGVNATWIESVPVRETFRGEIAWDGGVQVFQIEHPSGTQRAYAWSHQADEGGRRRFVAMLGLGPVVDAGSAVRASIAAG